MVFSEMDIIKTILLVLLASVAAIIYSLRIIVAMDRKLLRIEYHIDNIVASLIRKGSRKVKSSKKSIKKSKRSKKSKKKK